MYPAPQERALEIHQSLLAFYGEPVWRNPLPPVDELVSTILSQNTNDINRDKAFNALRAHFPTWEAVRDAPIEAVVECVRMAGLANQKGPRIQQVLRQITAERGGLEISFLSDLPAGRSPRLVDEIQRGRPQDCRDCIVFFAGPASLPGRYACLPRYRATWTAT